MYQPKSYRKFMAATLTTAAVVSAVAPAVSADAKSFSDVPQGSSHFEAVSALSAAGVINGYPDGSFGVNQPLSRSHAAVLFTRALDNVTVPDDVAAALSIYSDVDVNTQYANEIAAVTEAGIFHGSNGSFLTGDDVLTREQMATVIVKAFGLTDNGKDVAINLDGVSPSHKANVKILAEYGITTQLDNFRPSEAVTRGQFATFLYRAMDVAAPKEVVPDVTVKPGLTAFQRTVVVSLPGVDNDADYTVTVDGTELTYKADKDVFVGLVNSSDEAAIKAAVKVEAPAAPVEVSKTVEVKPGLTAFQRTVVVTLDVDNDTDYTVTVNGTELTYKADKDVFVGLVNSSDEEAIKAGVVVTAK